MSGVPEFNATSIAEFYAGRTLFITGATGFMGKVLLEKLSRSCPGIKTMYLLIRPKRGKDASTRLDELLKSQLFDKVLKQYPDFKKKIVPVVGDILHPGLGLNQSDLSKITSEVSVVFHSAATVKFDEALKLSIQMNVLGVKQLIDICQQITHLEAFIHVSTAYANCDKDYITEAVYSPPIHPQKLLNAIEWMSDDVVNEMTPHLIKPRPNTYTYTKALAEYLLVEQRGTLPCAIVRPSIVGCSLKEPMPGWVDNFNGPTGLLAAIGKGVLRTMCGNWHGAADIVPVDLATNLMIATAWYTAIHGPQDVPVFNCTTGQLNRVTWGMMERASYKYFMKNPLDNIARVPNPRFTSSRVWRNLNVWFDHHLPAWIMDIIMRIAGKQPIFTRIQSKLWKSVASLEYFTSKEWTFTNENVITLQDRLSEQDRETFNFDVRRINWQTYIENYCLGTKQYLLKEDLSQMNKARSHLYRVRRYQRVIKFLVIVFGWRFLMSRFQVARDLWTFLISLAYSIFKRIPGFAKSESLTPLQN